MNSQPSISKIIKMPVTPQPQGVDRLVELISEVRSGLVIGLSVIAVYETGEVRSETILWPD